MFHCSLHYTIRHFKAINNHPVQPFLWPMVKPKPREHFLLCLFMPHIFLKDQSRLIIENADIIEVTTSIHVFLPCIVLFLRQDSKSESNSY